MNYSRTAGRLELKRKVLKKKTTVMKDRLPALHCDDRKGGHQVRAPSCENVD